MFWWHSFLHRATEGIGSQIGPFQRISGLSSHQHYLYGQWASCADFGVFYPLPCSKYLFIRNERHSLLFKPVLSWFVAPSLESCRTNAYTCSKTCVSYRNLAHWKLAKLHMLPSFLAWHVSRQRQSAITVPAPNSIIQCACTAVLLKS